MPCAGFCRLQECTNDPTTVLQQFNGPGITDSLTHVVRAGIEASYAEKNEPFLLSEYEISQFVDKLDAADDKGEGVINSFIGSVVGIPTAEVPAWQKDVLKKAEELAAAEQAEENPKKKATAKPEKAGDWHHVESRAYGYGLTPRQVWFEFSYGQLHCLPGRPRQTRRRSAERRGPAQPKPRAQYSERLYQRYAAD